MGSSANMEDYGFEYSEEELEEQDVDIGNQYCNFKGCVEMDPEGAFVGFAEVVHMGLEKAEILSTRIWSIAQIPTLMLTN